MAKILIPTPLRQFADKQNSVELPGSTVAEALAALTQRYPDLRKQIYSDFQKLYAEEVPVLFIMHWDSVLIFNARIKGMPDKVGNPYQLYQEFHTFWIEEE